MQIDKLTLKNFRCYDALEIDFEPKLTVIVGENGKGVQRAYAYFRAAGIKDVSLKLYPDDRHEILNELDKDEVYDDILSWINEKVLIGG